MNDKFQIHKNENLNNKRKKKKLNKMTYILREHEK